MHISEVFADFWRIPPFYALIPGVVCVWHSQLLDLSGLLLTGSLPAAWQATMPSMVHLSLCNVAISPGLPAQWSLWGSLRTLALCDNLLTGTLPPAWDDLFTQLEHLDLSKNSLWGSLPTSPLGGALTYISLAHNSFSGPLPASWHLLPLSVVYLQKNSLTGELPAEWVTGMPGLTALNVADNMLTGQPLPSASFSGWPNIVSIDFSRFEPGPAQPRPSHLVWAFPHACYLRA